ncbi:hypothetical protein [Heyndrickxia faecalis]|uniref:hypothetical protein n=1 Tax=Heyndrickxia faecalis TaxID=2824910 RepID=UPI003D2092A1
MNEKKRRSLNLPLANPGLSNASKRLRRNNKLLLQRLRQIQAGPFGICTWFKKGK